MPSISPDTRVIFWVVAAVAGALSALFGNALVKNIIYFFHRKGRPPSSRPLFVWIIFFSGMVISISLGALAAFAPAKENRTDTALLSDQNPQLSESATSISIETTAPPNTPTPTTIPFTPTPKFSFEKFDHFDAEELGTEYEFLGIDSQPKVMDGYLYFDFLGENHYAVEESVLDKLSQIDVNLKSNALTFVFSSIAIDDATEGSYVFMQIHLDIVDGVVHYANFGLKDTGEIFIAKSTELYELGEIVTTMPGNPKGEFNTLVISFISDRIQFTANDESLYVVESLVNSLVLRLYVTAPKNGHIKTRWDYLGWSFFE